jgi:hypothetical protein
MPFLLFVKWSAARSGGYDSKYQDQQLDPELCVHVGLRACESRVIHDAAGRYCAYRQMVKGALTIFLPCGFRP